MTDCTDLDHLISRGQALAATGSRRLLGICGAPGAGKSTLAERLVTALGDRAVLVGMDGSTCPSASSAGSAGGSARALPIRSTPPATST